MSTSILKILGEDKDVIPYRKSLNPITGSINSTILLTQILYWWNIKKEKAFYKYKLPIIPQREDESDESYQERSKWYREGDSWSEDLDFSREEFDKALLHIAHNRTDEKFVPSSKYPIQPFIEYWTTRDRLTFYNVIDPEGLEELISDAIQHPEKYVRHAEKSVKDTLEENGNTRLKTSETTTEITSKTNVSSKEETNAFPAEKRNVDRNKLKVDKRSRLSEIKKKERKQVEKEKNQSFAPSKEALQILATWNEKGLPQHRIGTKSYIKASLAIDEVKKGTFFVNKEYAPDELKTKKFTLNDLDTAIERFALAALFVDYEPINKSIIKKISLLDFFYRNLAQSDKLEWKSPFLFYLNNEPKKVNERSLAKVDEGSEVTQYIMTKFKELTSMNGREFSAKEKNDIAICISRIKEVVPRYKEEMRRFNYWKGMVYSLEEDETLIAKFLMDAVKDEAESMEKDLRDINTGWLKSDRMFDARLPEYLIEIGEIRR